LQTSLPGVLKFICPANGCQYAKNRSKHFTSSKLLKQVSIACNFSIYQLSTGNYDQDMFSMLAICSPI